MKKAILITAGLFLSAVGFNAWADSTDPFADDYNSTTHAQEALQGKSDAQTGVAARQWLGEQASGKNRGETEPYSAEFAGKAYKAYVESIGATKSASSNQSQVSSISGN